MLNNLRIRIFQRLALNCMAEQKFELAKNYFLKIIAIDPLRKGTYFNLASTCTYLKNFSAAEKYYFKEIELFTGLNNLNFENLDQLDLEIDPVNLFRVFKALAESAYKLSERHRAHEYYTICRQLSSTDKDRTFFSMRIDNCSSEESYANVEKSEEYLHKGIEKLSKKEYENALELFQGSFEYDKTNFIALTNISSLYSHIYKDREKALEFLEQVDSIYDLPIVKANLNKLRKNK